MSNTSGSSSCSTDGRQRGRVYGVPTRCWCGEKVVELISKSDQNPFRRYYRCGFSASKKLMNDNHIFKWVDEAYLNEIEKLKLTVSRLDQEVKDSKRSDEDLEKNVMDKVEKKLEEIAENVEEKVVQAEAYMKKSMVVVVCASLVSICIMKLFG